MKWVNIYICSEAATRSVHTTQKMKFPIKGFFSKCDQIRSFLRICSQILKKSLIENFIFCAVSLSKDAFGNFPKFTGKHLCQSVLFNEVEGLSLQRHMFFSCEFGKSSKNTFFTEHLRATASVCFSQVYEKLKSCLGIVTFIFLCSCVNV